MRRFALLCLTLAACNAGEAGDIREQIRDDDYRNTYARAPGWEVRTQSGRVHGAWVDIYVNDTVEEAIEEAQASGESIERWPEGSIIVKDGWTSESGNQLDTFSFMERRSGGWFWAEYNDRDRLISAGKNDDTCTGCHAGGEDQVLAFGLPPYPVDEE